MYNVNTQTLDIQRKGNLLVRRPKDLEKLSAPQLVVLYNKNRGDSQERKRFSSMETGTQTTFAALKANAEPSSPKSGYRGHHKGGRREKMHIYFDKRFEKGLTCKQFVTCAVKRDWKENVAMVMYFEFRNDFTTSALN